MNTAPRITALPIILLLYCGSVMAQPGQTSFGKTWVLGESVIFSTTFNGSAPPTNQIIGLVVPIDLVGGNSSICDSAGNPLLICDGFNLYDRNLHLIDSGKALVPPVMVSFNNGFNGYSQSSIILPFDNGVYRLITPTASDDNCNNNWMTGGEAFYDLLLYDEIDMDAISGAGKVTKRMVHLLDTVKLTKSQMMACRHGDGRSWWLIKQAADTNMIYEFLFTQDRIYGPYKQGFGERISYADGSDNWSQSMFSQDGSRYLAPVQGYGKIMIADFDRCSGTMSNPKYYKVPPRWTNEPMYARMDSTITGVCFSPNGRYVYVSSRYNVQQLDLKAADPTNAWTFLSGPDTTWQTFMYYSAIYPGNDGRLYIGNFDGLQGQMSVINSPDSGGIAAGFCSKCLRFPGYYNPHDSITYFLGVSTPPCMPNYALGPTNPLCAVGLETTVPKAADLRLYPNPAQNNLTIEYAEPGTLNLYSATGALMQAQTLEAPHGRTSISVKQLPAGVYQYIFTARNGQKLAARLMIVH